MGEVKPSVNSYTAKVLIIGDVGVGKTSLLLRFTDNTFRQSRVMTLQRDFRSRSIAIGECLVTMNVWDTAGQESYKSLTSRFFRESNGVLLMFDVTNWSSFQKIESWLEEAEHHGIGGRSQFLLVGNKTDLLPDRVVDSTVAKGLAARLDLQYVETSAKENSNVDSTFALLGKQMLRQLSNIKTTPLGFTRPSSFTLERETETKGGTKRRKKCEC